MKGGREEAGGWRQVNRLLNIRSVRRAIELESGSDAPLSVRLRAWRLGFTSESYRLYDLDHNDPRSYLPDAARFAQPRIEGGFARILADKALFSTVVGAHVRVPKVLAIIASGRLCATQSPPVVRDVESLIRYCEGSSGVIIKPAQGSRGLRVRKLHVERGRLLLNGRATDANEIERRLARMDDFVVTEVIEQAGYAARIFPDSANTVRIVTMQDPDDGNRPFIPVATHRFGVRDSAPTDNWARGGLDTKIDLATGRLSRAKRNPRISSAAVERHPDTDAMIEGVTIPHWREVHAAILRLASTFSFLTFVGWDVIVTDDGMAVIEGNNPPDRVIQKEHPFMADPRARRFFETMMAR